MNFSSMCLLTVALNLCHLKMPVEKMKEVMD